MNPHALNLVWIALMAATGLTWFIGERGSSGYGAVIAMLAIAAVKGWLVIQDFMALRRVKFFWRAIVLGWLLGVLALVALAYGMGIQ